MLSTPRVRPAILGHHRHQRLPGQTKLRLQLSQLTGCDPALLGSHNARFEGIGASPPRLDGNVFKCTRKLEAGYFGTPRLGASGGSVTGRLGVPGSFCGCSGSRAGGSPSGGGRQVGGGSPSGTCGCGTSGSGLDGGDGIGLSGWGVSGDGVSGCMASERHADPFVPPRPRCQTRRVRHLLTVILGLGPRIQLYSRPIV